jgi:hypothetical protein
MPAGGGEHTRFINDPTKGAPMTSSTKLSSAAMSTFIAFVTACTMALLFTEVARGLEGAVGILIYGVTVAFGLEYLGSAWASRWRSPQA